MKKKKVYLTLENGKSFQGYRFGADGERVGQLVFSTGMVGYVETLTDPANYGQIVVQTFPLIGNYGVNESDAESEKAWLNAYVVRENCATPSNFRSETDLESFMIKKGVVGLYGVDTRELTKILREEGVMNAKISNKPLAGDEIAALSTYAVLGGVNAVAPQKKAVYGDEKAKYTVALWNFGCKNSVINTLVKQGLRVVEMPASATAEEILALQADGVVITGGAGNPAENDEAIEQIKKVVGKTPVFGIDFGHLLLALALGGTTKRHKYGHRGGNQPVKCTKTERVYVSSQNHGYTVSEKSITAGELSFVSVNDGSCEGIDYPAYKAFSVQFDPECCWLGNEKNPLYEKFFALMQKEKENA